VRTVAAGHALLSPSITRRLIERFVRAGPINPRLPAAVAMAGHPGVFPAHKYIGEAKSGTGKSAPKALDRLVWLRGLRELVGAESAELTIATPPSERVREVARSLGLVAQSIADLERREQQSVIGFEDCGSHGIGALQLKLRVHDISSSASSPARPSAAAPSAASRTSSPRSAPSSTGGTTAASPSPGPRQPTSCSRTASQVKELHSRDPSCATGPVHRRQLRCRALSCHHRPRTNPTVPAEAFAFAVFGG
jgi:hypothetical protein